jgi:hypothetical protein
MSKILIMLTSLLLVCTSVLAHPSEDERQTALKLMYLDNTDQELHFYQTNNYESTSPRWIDGLVHYSCAYSNFSGKGYITSVIKSEEGKIWSIQRHFGPDKVSINNTWTCVNCSGESFNFPAINEHGLCQ